jgi:hypothetical protein
VREAPVYASSADTAGAACSRARSTIRAYVPSCASKNAAKPVSVANPRSASTNSRSRASPPAARSVSGEGAIRKERSGGSVSASMASGTLEKAKSLRLISRKSRTASWFAYGAK